MQNASWKKPVPLWCVIPGILLEFRKQRKQITQQEAPREHQGSLTHLGLGSWLRWLIQPSPCGQNFTPCFLPAKAEAKNGKRSGFQQAEGMIPALHGDVMFTKGRVRAGDLLGPGPAPPGFASLFHILSTVPSRNCRMSQPGCH